MSSRCPPILGKASDQQPTDKTDDKQVSERPRDRVDDETADLPATFPLKHAADAKVEDTQIFAQTEAEMAEDEKLENLIEMGLAEREPLPHVAREVDSQ